MLRYAAFPFQRFGLYRGVVTEVTRAPVEDGETLDASGIKDADRKPGGLYRVVVTPDGSCHCRRFTRLRRRVGS
jgi:membrane fusion protein